jgi:small subunit ribosomal protein S20
MANIKSQKKRNRQNAARSGRNKAVKSELKTRVKNAQEASGSDKADELFKTAQARMDMAQSKGQIHPNTAARRKSRLAKRLAAGK